MDLIGTSTKLLEGGYGVRSDTPKLSSIYMDHWGDILESMKLLVALGFFASTVIFAPEVRAEDTRVEPTPKPEVVPVNQKLVAKVAEVEKSALHIADEDEGLVFLKLRGQSFVPKSQFVFFRRRGTRLQMIAMGVVEGERTNPKDQSKELVVNVDKDSIVKYPMVGDFGVPLADPLASSLGANQDDSNTALVNEPKMREKRPPGYLELGMGIMFGQLFSDGDPQVGGGKNSQKYRFPNTHFEYFSGLFPLGISYNAHSGQLPTQTYEGDIVNSSESISEISLFYRPDPFLDGRLEIWPKAFLLSDHLTTDNPGSELFTTSISVIGVGARLQYRFASDIWKPEKAKIAIQPLNVFGEFGFSPLVNALDTSPSRGTSSSGSTLLEYRLGVTALAWINFIPLLKRWVIQGSYGARNYSLAFQGPTISESGNPIQVAENLKTSESEKDFRFFVGVRFGDPLEGLFGDDEEEGEKKKKGRR